MIPQRDVEARLDDLARLRITVFAEYPYLYAGDMDYERAYLSACRNSREAIVVGAWEGDRLVGAATGTPMEDHAAEFALALETVGLDPQDVFYCAESVLLPDFRGRGAGHRFFDLREDRARRLGRRWSAFCAVIRSDDHPARPAGYRPLDGFWTRRGYAKVSGAVARFAWRDIGVPVETVKSMQFWIRRLKEDTP